MSDKDSAFPSHFGGAVSAPELGLTKREYFAGLAMQGVLAYPGHFSDPVTGAPSRDAADAARLAAKFSVDYADALLAALAEPQP